MNAHAAIATPRASRARGTLQRLLSAGLLLAPLACVSSFRYEPEEGHPARADTAPSAPVRAASPYDYEPPEPAGGSDQMSGEASDRREPSSPMSGRERR